MDMEIDYGAGTGVGLGRRRGYNDENTELDLPSQSVKLQLTRTSEVPLGPKSDTYLSDQFGFSSDIEFATNKPRYKHTLFKSVIRFTLTISILLGLSFGFYWKFFKTQGQTPDVVTKPLDLDIGSHRKYPLWLDVKEIWAPCLPIKECSLGQERLGKLNMVLQYRKMTTQYTVNLTSLEMIQENQLNTSNAYGNFTTPIMYLRNSATTNNYSPCVCSLSIEENSEHWASSPLVLHMYNMKPQIIRDLRNDKLYSMVKVSVPFIAENEEPFWVEVPSKINATFTQCSGENPMENRELIFTNKVNIINLMLCYRISNVLDLKDIIAKNARV